VLHILLIDDIIGSIHWNGRKSMTKQTHIKYRILADILIVFAVLFSLAACQTTGTSTAQLKPELVTKKIYVIGHRGGAGLSPENTLSAFRRALDLKVDAVELDVLLTSDRKLVVHHDYRLKQEIARTPDGKWLKDRSGPAIKDLTLAELKTYDVGRLKPNTNYARQYPEQHPADGERIPTLREVISLFKSYDKKTQLWVEIKTSPEKPDMTPSPEAVADALAQLLREQNFAGRVHILSFDWRALVHVQKITPEIPTVYVSLEGRSLNNIKAGQPGASPWLAGLDIDDFNGSIPQAVKAAGGRYWAPYYKHITYDLLNEAHELGLEVFAWTPDERGAMVRLIEMGVDGIITNRPDILQSILSGNQG
jgi:glycerophosphoryl diester phosphodiesterase